MKTLSNTQLRIVIYILFAGLLTSLLFIWYTDTQTTESSLDSSQTGTTIPLEGDTEMVETVDRVEQVLSELDVPPEDLVFIQNCDPSEPELQLATDDRVYFLNGADTVELSFSHEPDVSYRLVYGDLQTFAMPGDQASISVSCNGEPFAVLTNE
jgi:hypothetical protein